MLSTWYYAFLSFFQIFKILLASLPFTFSTSYLIHGSEPILLFKLFDVTPITIGMRLYLKHLRDKSPLLLAQGSHINGNVIVDGTAVIGRDCRIGLF